MSLKIGVDVGGTFTDFVMARDGEPPFIHKTLSTPADPSIAAFTPGKCPSRCPATAPNA